VTPPPALALHLERLATPIGTLLVVSDDSDVLRAVDWEDYRRRFDRLLQRHYGRKGHVLDERPAGSAASAALRAYFAGDLAAIDGLAVATNGTPFQQAVWQALRGIAPGRTITYGELAERSGRPRAVRAAGFANGQNPIGIVVPCHRVIGRDGTLTGYGGGLHRKQWLLGHEGARPG
jgi:methylated-DNA-[protein]-cysteine S-methyltransferase